jgi:hypothetical protein
MIFIKWATLYDDNAMAPSLINTMIGWTSLQKLPLWGTGDEQQSLMLFLLFVSLACLPLMLFPKPFILGNMKKGGQE